MLKSFVKRVFISFREGSYRTSISDDERHHLQKFHDLFKGQRCFIVGNGPSLNRCDLSLLKDEHTFGVNSIYLKTEEVGFRPTFYVVEDEHVLNDNIETINHFDCRYKFFPSSYKDRIDAAENTFFFSFDSGFYRQEHRFFGKPRFSKDFSEVVYAGQSVTFINLQLAYYMGFSEVYLIGMDFSYKIPKSAIVEGQTLLSTEDDVNHFHPDYFGQGKRWHDPQLEKVLLSYKKSKEVFESDGRKIYNATVGGELSLFERIDFGNLF